MATHTAIAEKEANPAFPSVREIELADLRYALAKGLDDFNANPSHLLFLGMIYPVAGLILARLAAGYEVLPLIYPLMAGFTLIGPFAAIGLYEISRRREKGLEASWRHAIDVLRSPSIGAITLLGAVLTAIFIGWLATAQAIYSILFGDTMPESVREFVYQILMTRAGWTLIAVGNAVGFLFALLTLTISVVSFPLLLDHNVSAAAAVRTSVKAVTTNPGPMACWGLIVAVALAAGMLPFFVGLAVVVPVLGHSTWHLYRRVVEIQAT